MHSGDGAGRGGERGGWERRGGKGLGQGASWARFRGAEQEKDARGGGLGKEVMGCGQGTGVLGHDWVPAVCAGLSPRLWGDTRLGAGRGYSQGHRTKGRQTTP